MGHVTVENRHGLAVAGMVTKADSTAERRASQAMLKAKRKAVGHCITAGGDKAYDTKDHIGTCVPSASRRMWRRTRARPRQAAKKRDRWPYDTATEF